MANGFSPEARVLAGLIGNRQATDVLVLHHDWSGDRESARRFEQTARAPVRPYDMGWRPPPAGWSAVPRKVLARVRFRLAWPALVNSARGYDPDLVISSQQIWDCSAATYLATRLHKPQVVQLHYSIGWWLGSAVLARLKTCAHVIAISEFIKRQAIESGVPAERVTTIKNAMLPLPDVDSATQRSLRRELHVSADACLVGFVARLDPYKGHAEAIEAFARVCATRPDIHLVIAGRGGLEGILKQQASATGFASQIHFLGYRSDVPRLLGSLDVFIHPSYNEPFGLSVLEAAAAGLPVVAFRSGATAEIVEHEQTGLLATEGNRVELAAYLARLADDPDARGRMGAAGRQRVIEDFSPAAAATRFETLLHKVAETD